MKKYYIGYKNDRAISSKETKKQIKILKKMKLSLHHENGQEVNWVDLDDPSNPRSLFQAIILDRKERVDNRIPMADRPNFCIVTVNNDSIERLEYYEGHDLLELIYDIRAKHIQGQHLEKGYEEGPEVKQIQFTNMVVENVLGSLFEDMIMIRENAHRSIISRKKDEKLVYFARNSQSLHQHQIEYATAIGNYINLYNI